MPTEDMVADLLTKPLQGDLFIREFAVSTVFDMLLTHLMPLVWASN